MVSEAGLPAFGITGTMKDGDDSNDIRLGFGSNDEPVCHLRLAILSRTTGQGAPAVGSLR